MSLQYDLLMHSLLYLIQGCTDSDWKKGSSQQYIPYNQFNE